MRYHLFQKFFGKMVRIKEMSFLSTRGMGLMFGNCIVGDSLCNLAIRNGYLICVRNIEGHIAPKHTVC